MVYTFTYTCVQAGTHVWGMYMNRVDSCIGGEDTDTYARMWGILCIYTKCAHRLAETHAKSACPCARLRGRHHLVCMHRGTRMWTCATATQQPSALSPSRPPCPIREPDMLGQCSWHGRGGEVWWLRVRAAWLSPDSALHSLCILGQVT